MSFSDKIKELVYAGFSGLWIETLEANQALHELQALAVSQKWVLTTWDFANRLRILATGADIPGQVIDERSLMTEIATPQGYLDYIRKASSIWAELHGVGQPEEDEQLAQQHRSLFVISNWEDKPDVIGNLPIQDRILDILRRGQEGEAAVLVFLSSGASPPAALRKVVTELQYGLPTRSEIEAAIDKSLPKPLPEDEHERAVVLSSFSGLTRVEATNIGSLSLLRTGQYDPRVIWEMKAEQINRTGYMKVYSSDESLVNLGGLSHVKSFAMDLLRHPQTDPDRMPRGLLLLGIPGCGKTQLAKVLGAATQRETLIFDVRAVQDSYIGSSEKRLRQALAIADSMAPCNLVIDEVEKALSGSSPGSSSSGVMSGIMGTLLSYLSDRRTDVFVMCTSNDVTSLPPEFSRSERFDAMFFVDVPTAGEREQIWTIWLKKYGLPVDKLDHLVAESEDWTGAEIKSACRLAVLRAIPVEQSMLSVVPIIHTAGDLLQRTREWASSRCLSAAKPARYSLPTKLKALPQPAGKRRVKV
jgi:hypothetical protein